MKNNVINMCLQFNDAIETYPFKDKQYQKCAVIRHKSNGKWFALIFYIDNILYINLKTNPIDAVFLRETYDFITPAWHMNKTHWIKIKIEDAPQDLLYELIKISFDLTTPKTSNH